MPFQYSNCHYGMPFQYGSYHYGMPFHNGSYHFLVKFALISIFFEKKSLNKSFGLVVDIFTSL
jgi:hypothetical protein